MFSGKPFPVGGTPGRGVVKNTATERDASWDHVFPEPGKGHLVVGVSGTPSASDPTRGYGSLEPGSIGAFMVVKELGGDAFPQWQTVPATGGPFVLVLEEGVMRWLQLEDYKYPTKNPTDSTAISDYVRSHA